MPNFSGVWSLSSQLQAIGDQTWPMSPAAPTSVSAAAGNTQVTISFSAPSFEGIPTPITGYLATSTPGNYTATGSSSPLTVTGLTNGTAYTFSVQATNAVGYGVAGTSGSVSPSLPPRGLFAGGRTGTRTNVIDYILITTTGNATDFGDLTVARQISPSLISSNTRTVFNAGYEGTSAQPTTMDYVTTATTGNATDFGDLTVGRYGASGCSNQTRGLIMGGDQASGTDNTISYITIASTGNGSNFGDLTTAPLNSGGSSSPTRGVRMGGNSSNVIDYVTIASVGNATDFGDMAGEGGYNPSGANSNTRICIGGAGGDSGLINVIQYITTASTGNTSDFGDLLAVTQGAGGTSNSTRGVYGGGETSSGRVTTIQYITISSTGNATNFGNLTEARHTIGCGSSTHGGL